MKNLIFPLLLLALLIGCKRNKQTETSADSTAVVTNHLPPVPVSQGLDASAMEKARLDLKKGNLKYYHHSIALPNASFMKLMKDSLHITVAGIDRPVKEELSYNLITDSIVLAKTGKSVETWLKESK